jgi:hypothetical protein
MYIICNSLQETNFLHLETSDATVQKRQKIETEINVQIRIGCMNKERHGRKLVFVLQTCLGLNETKVHIIFGSNKFESNRRCRTDAMVNKRYTHTKTFSNLRHRSVF